MLIINTLIGGKKNKHPLFIFALLCFTVHLESILFVFTKRIQMKFLNRSSLAVSLKKLALFHA